MKTKTYKNFILSVIFIPLFLSSCEKMVEVDLPANQIASQQVYADVQTADAALAGIYAGLYSNSLLSGDRMGLLLSLYTDDLDFFAPTATNGMMELYSNQLIPTNAVVYTQWSGAYQLIYSCNAIIEGIERSASVSAADKARIKAEAQLIRSILLYYLQQLFGDIPYPVTTDYKVNQSLPKLARAEVLQKLETHLSESTTVLPDAYRNPERIFLNRKGAQLMLAKVFLEQKRWSEAEVLLKGIINAGSYSVQNDLSKTFKKSGTHILWQLKPANSGDATKEVVAYYFDFIPPYNYALSPDLMAAFSAGDLRKAAWTKPVTVGSNTWYRAYKYKNLTGNTDEYSIVFRIEEVYLLLAETLARQDRTAEALLYLNPICTRAGLAPVTGPMTEAALLDEIVRESRVEFFTEMGHRFFDLKRADRLNVLVTKKPNWKPHFTLWPVPEKELLLNPNLKPQNSGY